MTDDFDVPDPERPFDPAVDLHPSTDRTPDGDSASQTVAERNLELEDPIDYEYGVRVLKNAGTIEEAHEAYACPVLGGWGGYQAACHTCSWRGRVRLTKAEAWDEAIPHGREMEFQIEARESISEYAARMVDERDEALDQRETARRERDDAENHAATAESENTHLRRERDAARAELARIKAEFEVFARDALRRTGGESA